MRIQQLVAALLLPVSLAADISGQVILNSLANHSVPIGSRVSVGYAAPSSLIRSDGTFTVYGVPDGEHFLNTIVPGYAIQPVLLTISSDKVHAQPYIPSRLALPTSSPSLPLPLQLQATPEEYYTPAPSLNLSGMFRNPMVLMMLFSGLMLFGLPKIVSNMDIDEETRKDIISNRKKVESVQSMDFMSSLSSVLAGEQKEEPQPPRPAKAKGNGSNQKKRR